MNGQGFRTRTSTNAAPYRHGAKLPEMDLARQGTRDAFTVPRTRYAASLQSDRLLKGRVGGRTMATPAVIEARKTRNLGFTM
jgi:hypothetical protein